MRNLCILLTVLYLGTAISYSQKGFVFEEGVDSDKISFELINNLIVIPVELNGLKLSFLLDTGVNSSVLLSLEEGQTLDLHGAESVKLKGLGGEEYIEALKSEKNQLKVGKSISKDLMLLVITDMNFNFSPRLGFPVHGILGHDFFKEFIVEINYRKKTLEFYKAREPRKNTRKYETLPLQFTKNKPYIETTINLNNGKSVETVMLIDTGLGEAIWLFKDDEKIEIPENSYADFIGLGLIGDIYGKKSSISSMELAGYSLEAVNASFPDSTSVAGLQQLIGRNGSIGAEVLRRFHLILDYGGKKLFLRKNSNFSDPFTTNMAGITIEHSGYIVVENRARAPSFSTEALTGGEQEIWSGVIPKTFSLKPEFTIARIREGSPAEQAGLKIGDVILKVNGRRTTRMKMEKIFSIFSSRAGKNVHLKIKRKGEVMKYKIRLQDPME